MNYRVIVYEPKLSYSLQSEGIRVERKHWLEKQGQEEYALKSSKDEDVRKFMQQIKKEAKDYEFNLPNRDYDIYAFAKDILAWLEKQGEPKSVKSEQNCYHNDGLYYAIDILAKTFGKVEGYQSDDGITEHQTAIEAVNALYHKKPSEWSEEDEERIEQICEDLKCGFKNFRAGKNVKGLHFERIIKSNIDWLKSLKDRVWLQPKQGNNNSTSPEELIEKSISKCDKMLVKLDYIKENIKNIKKEIKELK